MTIVWTVAQFNMTTQAVLVETQNTINQFSKQSVRLMNIHNTNLIFI